MGGPAQALSGWAVLARAGINTPAVPLFGAQGWFRFLATHSNNYSNISTASSRGSDSSCGSSRGSSGAGQEASPSRKQRILFLGTPQVAALVLERLLAASRLPGSNFEVAAVVSRPSGRHWLERERERGTAAAAEQERPAASSAAASTPAAASASPATTTAPLAPRVPVAGSGAATSSSAVPPAAGSYGGTGPGREATQPSNGAAATSGGGQAAGVAAAPASAGRSSLGARAPNWSRHGASAVERVAAAAGLPPDRIMCPVSAKEPGFLAALAALQPDLAVTAAYGALLPQAFLDLPRCGTLNIHPSLLPKYRGAAPVVRALQDGVAVSGVSLVFTVLKCDAGPVLEQQEVPVPPDVQAPQLTEQLFTLGAELLLRHLPGVLARGRAAAEGAARQDEAAATYAHKILRQEAYLDFRLPAARLHNTVRALAGWPGARATLLLEAKGTGTRDPIEVKILRTHVASPNQLPAHSRTRHSPHGTQPRQAQGYNAGTGAAAAAAAPAAAAAAPLPPGVAAQVVVTTAGELLVPCGDGSLLQILEVGRRGGGVGSVDAPSKSLTAKEFIAGLARRRLYVPLSSGTGTVTSTTSSSSRGSSITGQRREL